MLKQAGNLWQIIISQFARQAIQKFSKVKGFQGAGTGVGVNVGVGEEVGIKVGDGVGEGVGE